MDHLFTGQPICDAISVSVSATRELHLGLVQGHKMVASSKLVGSVVLDARAVHKFLVHLVNFRLPWRKRASVHEEKTKNIHAYVKLCGVHDLLSITSFSHILFVLFPLKRD
jgi:hypothetical protein